MEMLESHGIATTYEPSVVTATCGQVLRGLSAAQIEQLLCGGILLDGEAAQVLVQRGFGAWIGLQRCDGLRRFDDPAVGPVAAEAIVATDFGGGHNVFLTATLPDIAHDVKGAGRILCARAGARVAGHQLVRGSQWQDDATLHDHF